ncbi:MAG TPA: CRISPR system precrRNA processing endoribonuclease RAMP protein Cas6 [Desulfuromonadaceae bacterium]
MEFNLIDLKIDIETDDPAGLRAYLFRSEAAFAKACKQAACLNPAANCTICRLKSDCAWQAVFGQELSVDSAALRRHQKPPLPFVFSFPVCSQLGNPQALECRLSVVGSAVPHLELLLQGFRVLLSRAECPVSNNIQVYSRDYQGNSLAVGKGADINKAENLIILSANELADRSPWQCSRLTIRLLSPLKLLSNGSQLRQFEFGLFFRSLMRRVSSLAYYYGGHELDYDYKSLADLASTIICSENRFSYQSEMYGDKKMAGIHGSGCFEGDFSALMPMLVLGTYLHTGKKASFGLGYYEILSDQK